MTAVSHPALHKAVVAKTWPELALDFYRDRMSGSVVVRGRCTRCSSSFGSESGPVLIASRGVFAESIPLDGRSVVSVSEMRDLEHARAFGQASLTWLAETIAKRINRVRCRCAAEHQAGKETTI